jgi:outer membrane protein assembly factor BamD (BamD/ComL family)
MKTGMKIIFYVLFSTLFLMACVSQEEYDRVEREKQQAEQELYDLKYGIPQLLAASKEAIANKDFELAKQKLQVLMREHPESVEASQAKETIKSVEEELAWERAASAFSSTVTVEHYLNLYPNGKYRSQAKKKMIEVKVAMEKIKANMEKEAFERAQSIHTQDAYESFMEEYPNGKYKNAAKKKVIEIKAGMEKGAFESAQSSHTKYAYESFLEKYPNSRFRSEARNGLAKIKEAKRQDAYDSAKRRNTSRAWQNLIDDYPNYNTSAIRDKIIALEVDEIMGDSETGKLPSFQRSGYGSSASSSVEIENDTGRRLTVRYSGPTIKKIEIGVGGSRSVSLVSGNYKVTASAGGLHYAGSDYLSGSYSSKFYISTSSYRY